MIARKRIYKFQKHLIEILILSEQEKKAIFTVSVRQVGFYDCRTDVCTWLRSSSELYLMMIVE